MKFCNGSFATAWLFFLIGTVSQRTLAWVFAPSFLSTNSWNKKRYYHVRRSSLSLSASSSMSNEKQKRWQHEGNKIIRAAAKEVGARDQDILIEWKVGKIIVTFNGKVVEPLLLPDGKDEIILFEEGDEIEYDEELDNDNLILEDDFDMGGLVQDDTAAASSTDVTRLARAIIAAFDSQGEEGSIGWYICHHYEIEVTTPGFDGTLTDPIMFESYKGFDVIVEANDEKKKNKKKTTIEGKLMERNDKFTRINVKGRIRKLKNENVMSVRLPKAKKEKGVR